MKNIKMNQFIKSGKISDYLDYKNSLKKDEEISKEFIKGETNVNKGRNHCKDN